MPVAAWHLRLNPGCKATPIWSAGATPKSNLYLETLDSQPLWTLDVRSCEGCVWTSRFTEIMSWHYVGITRLLSTKIEARGNVKRQETLSFWVQPGSISAQGRQQPERQHKRNEKTSHTGTQTHTCLIEARLYGNCRSWWVRKAGWKHTVWKENDEGKVVDIPAAHNDAQGLSVMRSAPKLRPRTPMSGLVLPSCAQRRPWPAQAGTGTCVHIPIQLIPIASLAWLGKQQPCPLLSVGCMGLLETECDTHTWPSWQGEGHWWC